jgi:hypothetical protein
MRCEDDYYVDLKRSAGRYLGTWTWEVRRKSSPMGVLLQGQDQNEARARAAGQNALKELLRSIKRDAAETTRRPSTRPFVPRDAKRTAAPVPVFPKTDLR